MNYVSELNQIIEQNLAISHFDNGATLKKLLNSATKLYSVAYNILEVKTNPNHNIILPEEMILLRKNISRLKIELGLKKSIKETNKAMKK